MIRNNCGKYTYTMERRSNLPAVVFPEGYDRSNLLEISTIGESFAVFLNTETMETVRCETFYKQLLKEQESWVETL